MRQEVIISGFGGQGVIKAGVLLATAAMHEGKHCTHFPSYGAEMRGGTANCSVIVSSDEIASPVITNPDTAIVLNEPSMDKFEPRLKKGGLLIYNSSLIPRKPKRDNITAIAVPANDIAEKLGTVKCANMTVLGAYIAQTGAVTLDSIKSTLTAVFYKLKQDLINTNKTALDEGAQLAKK